MRPVRKVARPNARHRYPGEVMDLTGQRYGRLVAVRFVGRADDYGRSIWLWKCDCGALTEKLASNVRQGCTHSCGCLRKHKAPPIKHVIETYDPEEHW